MKQPQVVTKELPELSSSAALALGSTKSPGNPCFNGLSPQLINKSRICIANAFKSGIGGTRMGQAGAWLAGPGGGLLKLEIAKKEFDAANTDDALAGWLGKWMTTRLNVYLQACLSGQQKATI